MITLRKYLCLKCFIISYVVTYYYQHYAHAADQAGSVNRYVLANALLTDFYLPDHTQAKLINYSYTLQNRDFIYTVS